MSKLEFANLFIISDLLCLFALWIGLRSKSRFRLAIASVTGMGLFTTTAYTFTLLCNTYQAMSIAYGIYFFSMDWLCATLGFFLLTYSYQFDTKTFRRLVCIVTPIALVDSVSQLVNIWTSHSVTYEVEVLENGDMLFALIGKWPFQVHLTICYIMLAFGFGSLILRTVTASKMYRIQYLSILNMLILIVGINAIFVFGGFKIDISVMGYSVCAIFIALYTIHKLPKQLADHISGRLVITFKSIIMLFDDFGSIIFENELAEQFRDNQYHNVDEVLQALNLQIDDFTNEYRQDVTYIKDGKETILDLRYQHMTEKTILGHQKFIGSYLLMDDVTEQRSELRKREYIASHDELTGLYNQNEFIRQATKLIKRKDGVTYAIAMTNISQFKLYNEVFGENAGDQLIKKIADNFQKIVKISNIVYGRFEADRFVACLPYEFCTQENVVLYKIDDPVRLDKFKVINYVGVCKVENGQQDVKQLCERAAIALNTIKGDAKTRLAYYDPSMKDELLKARELIAAFPIALEKDEIKIFVQPQMNQITGRLIGAEALVRWINEEGTMISPGEFIPILEKNGLITELDLRVWEKACALIRAFLDQGKEIAISVNISTQDIYRLDLFETFTELVKKYQIPEKLLKLEITESNFLLDMEEELTLIQKLQAAGFIVEMDDFGSGYSSLNSLKDITVDVIKMDLRFLENVRDTKRGQVIIRNVISMAKELETMIIAEGVETQEQAQILADMGCTYVQGYLFGRPMPVEEFVHFCEQNEYEEMK